MQVKFTGKQQNTGMGGMSARLIPVVLLKIPQTYSTEYAILYLRSYAGNMPEKTRKAKMENKDTLVQETARIFGENIHVLRKHNGLSQETLGFMAGNVSRSHVSDIENGIIDLRLSEIIAFSQAFGLPSYQVLLIPGGALHALRDGHAKL